MVVKGSGKDEEVKVREEVKKGKGSKGRRR